MEGYKTRNAFLFLVLLSGQVFAYKMPKPKRAAKSAPTIAAQPRKVPVAPVQTPPALQEEIQKIKTAIAALPQYQTTNETISAAAVTLLKNHLTSLSTDDIAFLDYRRIYSYSNPSTPTTDYLDYLVDQRLDELQPKHFVSWEIADRLHRLLSPRSNYISWVCQLVEKYPDQVTEKNYATLLNYLPASDQEKCVLVLLSHLQKDTTAQFICNLLGYLPTTAQRDHWVRYLVDNHFAQIKSCIGNCITYVSQANEGAVALAVLKNHYHEIDAQDLLIAIARLSEKDKDEWAAFLLKNRWAQAKVYLSHYLSYLSCPNKRNCVLHLLKNHLSTLSRFDFQTIFNALNTQDKDDCIYDLITTDFSGISHDLWIFFDHLSQAGKTVCAGHLLKKHSDELNYSQLDLILPCATPQEKDVWAYDQLMNKWADAKVKNNLRQYFKCLSPINKEKSALHLLKHHRSGLSCKDFTVLSQGLTEKDRTIYIADILDKYLNAIVPPLSYSAMLRSCLTQRPVVQESINPPPSPYDLESLLEQYPHKATWCAQTLEKYFKRLPDNYTSSFSKHLTEKDKTIWLTKIFIKKFHPISSYLAHHKVPGPLFSSYFSKYAYTCIINPNHPHFTALLPSVFTYVATEYTNKRIVFFHGQQSQWNFLERLFRELYQLTEKTQTPEDFIWLRYKKIPGLSDTQVTDHFKTFSYNNRPHLLFANLHLFANHQGSNSWDYITNNSDQTTNKYYDNVTHRITNLFEEVGLTKEYEQVKKDCTTLHALHKDAISELGNHGTLLVISMPESTARTVSYSASSGGPERKITINSVQTSDVVTIAHNFEQAPFDNEYCIILGPDMCNPERAAKAGIRMKRFNPVITGKTKKYQRFEEELEKLMAKVKQLYEARMANEPIKK